MIKFFVFCHLLNDNSGSPTVLRSTLEALNAGENGLLYVGSQGCGALEGLRVQTRRYWYRRSRFRIVTIFTYCASQIALYLALNRARDIPAEATIFVNTLLPFGAMLWGKRNGRPVVVHVHEATITPVPLRWILTQIAGRCAQQLFYVSNDHYKRLPIHGPPARVLPNPVSPSISKRANDHMPPKDGAFRVLMLSSLRAYKGVEEFMVLAAALRERADITFDLVLNAEPDEVSDYAMRHSDMNNVTIHPVTDDPASFYAQANLLLNLSRVDQVIETFGLTLIEAMTFGIPVIAPPVGGPAEIVTNGVDGYCIDSRDVAALQDAVTGLADDQDTYSAMSLAAKRRAKDFSFTIYSTALRAALHASDRGPSD